MCSLPIGLGETAERALPAWAVSLPLECTLLGVKVLYSPVRAAHQDLPAEKGRMEEEQGCRARLLAQAGRVLTHLGLATCAPAQSIHRLLTPRLSGRREV